MVVVVFSGVGGGVGLSFMIEHEVVMNKASIMDAK
jgi:hypothetical protein